MPSEEIMADDAPAPLTAAAPGLTEKPIEVSIAFKPTNPKDMMAVTKLPLFLVPDSVQVYAALSFAEGAAKYGAYNWRAAGVQVSIYVSAMERHIKKYKNGEWADPKTKVPHLASVIACAGIILDANLCGKLYDDRPPAVDYSTEIDALEATVQHITNLFKDKQPHHWTIQDDLGGDVG